jgi:UDP-glucose 4-epimerase
LIPKEIIGKDINFTTAPRRQGDATRLVASPDKINKTLGWKVKYGLSDIIKSAWIWEQKRDINDYL